MKKALANLLALLPDCVLDRLTRICDWATEAVEWSIFARHVRGFARRHRG